MASLSTRFFIFNFVFVMLILIYTSSNLHADMINVSSDDIIKYNSSSEFLDSGSWWKHVTLISKVGDFFHVVLRLFTFNYTLTGVRVIDFVLTMYFDIALIYMILFLYNLVMPTK
jgi:hypothetical protein